MFDFDAGKLLIVGVIALIFIPPKDLPRALRTAGQFVGKMRRMAAEFQGQFMDAMREADMADVRREAQKLADSARLDHGLNDVEHTMTQKSRGADERAVTRADSHGVDVHGFHDDEFEPKLMLDARPETDQAKALPDLKAPQEPKAETASHTA